MKLLGALACLLRGHVEHESIGERAHDRDATRTERIVVVGCGRCDRVLRELVTVSQHPRIR